MRNSRRGRARVLIAATAALALLTFTGPANPQEIPTDNPGPETIAQLGEAVAVAEILERLEGAAPSNAILFRNARVIDPDAASVSPPSSVLIRDGRIVSVARGRVRVPKRTFVIDAAGRFLAPGLVDAHVHTGSAASPLLNLAHGVTSVREMDGFPWMLHWRAAARQRRMLAPYPYVAGTILNAFPMDGYALVTKTPEDARKHVRAQAACGYDFIKTHNALRRDVFDAIAAEAAAVRIPLVGHVPHDIPVRHAAQAGMRTMEHLKGWLNDRNLQLGDRDYALVRDFRSLWVVPTLYSTQDSLRGADARAFLASPQAAYVQASRRESWRARADEPADDVTRLRQEQRAKMVVIVRELHKHGARFLAGTDADGYAFTLAGRALLDEMRLLMDAGLTPAEVLRAATSEAARAFGRAGEFGTVRPGARADLVLLRRNPLEDPGAYADHDGVMANGRWLSRPALDAALGEMRGLFARAGQPDAIDGGRLAADTARLSAAGFVFDSAGVANAAGALRKRGDAAAAARLDATAALTARCPAS